LRLNGKRALVTAAAQGIGRSIAEAFVAQGATVYAADLNGELLATVPGVTPIMLDVTDAEAVAALPAQIGDIDILVNGAGYVHAGDILACDEDAFAFSMSLNVTSMYRLCRAFLPGMLAQGSGSIVNLASIASSVKGIPNRFAYGTTKAAVIGLTKAIAADYVLRGVRCNAICPCRRAGERGRYSARRGDRRLRRAPARRPPWPPRGDRSARVVPCVRRECIHHRHDPCHRRRLGQLTTPFPTT
jgi:2-keto-3-deoxy-L-fuconate dehydrogenase